MTENKEVYQLRYHPRTEGLFFEPVNGSKGLAAHLGRVYSGKAVVDILRRVGGTLSFIRAGENVIGIVTENYFVDASGLAGFGRFLFDKGVEYENQRDTKKEQHLKKQKRSKD